jgi:hypothetical protein
VDITYDGGADAPTNAGSYAVTGTVNEVLIRARPPARWWRTRAPSR